MKKRLVVFDFDGTVTNKDTMIAFTKFYWGNFRFFLGMFYLFPQLLFYKIGLIPNWKAKEHFLTYFFEKESLSKFQEKGDRFALEVIPTLLRPGALEQIEKYRENGDQIVFVSASAENWLKAWFNQKNIPLIATHLKIDQGIVTGKLLGANCYGPEKVERLKKEYDLEAFTEIIAYGDSNGDRELFEISSEHYFKPFRN